MTCDIFEKPRMIRSIKEDSWLAILIETNNELGGVGNYQGFFPIAKRIRQELGGSWTAEAHATSDEPLKTTPKIQTISGGEKSSIA